MDIISLLFSLNHGSLIVTSVSVTVIIMSLCITILAIQADTKIQRMIHDLSYHEELFNSLGSNIDDVFIIFDSSNQKIEYVSPNFEKEIGLRRDVLIIDRLKLMEYVPEKERWRILEILNSPLLMESRQIEFEANYAGIIKNDKKRWFSVRIFPAFNKDILRYVICISDITKEKEDQRLIKESLENVRKANEAKKEFLSHMSHEIKTPINSIIGMTQVAQKAIEDQDKVINCLSKISYASDRLLEIINNILDMSKIDSHKLVLNQEPFSLCKLVTQFSSIITCQAELHNKNFTLFLNNIQDNNLIGDSMRLYQILGNCISNSLKFTSSGGKINLEVVQTAKTDDTINIRFIISDTGIGMSEEFLERIFVPFDQEDSNILRTYGGTGLGMPIAKSLVQLMGGNIQVSSIKDSGTTVTIDIPFIKGTYQKQPANTTMERNKYDCSGRRVLVVEDNEINREITCEFLKYLDINVETASNGYEAIRLFEASAPGYFDGILMDIKMPVFDGYETSAAIRRSTHPDAKRVCIIAMTADNFAEEHRSIDNGMNFHITKPIDIDYFCSMLHNAFEK